MYGVAAPVRPPIAPMLARLADDLPDDALYEPKWDGFRAIAFRDGDAIDIRSRHDRRGAPLAFSPVEVVARVRERGDLFGV